MVAEFDYADLDVSRTMVCSHCVGTVVSIISYKKLKEPDLRVGDGAYISIGNRDFDLSKCKDIELYGKYIHVIISHCGPQYSVMVNYIDDRIPNESYTGLTFADMVKKAQELLTKE